jgi:hypothetical protein
MKTSVLLLLLFISSISLYSQQEIELSILREPAKPLRKKEIPIYVNSLKAFSIKNGDSVNYKVALDQGKPLSVLAKYGMNKRGVTVYPIPGRKVLFNLSYNGGLMSLDILSGAKLKPGTGTVAGTRVNKKNLAVSYTSTTVDESDTLRQQWIEKGGWVQALSRSFGASFMGLNSEGMKTRGYGAFFVVTSSWLNLKVPAPKPGLQKWHSAILGYSFREDLYVSTYEIEMEGMEPYTDGSASFTLMLTANVGYTLGLGKYKNPNKWKGVAFDLSYKPSVYYDLLTEGSEVHLNMAGFGLDVNFNSYASNAARIAPRAESKISIFALPPIKGLPLYLSIGYGRTFYRKIYKRG